MQEKRIQLDGEDTEYLVRDDGTVWSEKRNRILCTAVRTAMQRGGSSGGYLWKRKDQI